MRPRLARVLTDGFRLLAQDLYAQMHNQREEDVAEEFREGVQERVRLAVAGQQRRR